MGNPHATEAEMLQALRTACADFVLSLPDGIDANLNEQGGGLSEGQAQRIAIARAILKDAPIVILDEATAFTDPENEDKIQRSIMALSRGKNAAGYRPPALHHPERGSDRGAGKGAYRGPGHPAELLRRCLLYQKLWQAHIGAQGWAVTSGAKEGQ